MNPLVTIILRSYDRPALLARAINSVLAQTFEDFELIISDDCSPSVEVIKTIYDFAEKDKRIFHIIQSKNHGFVSRGTNDAIKQAQGQYICFLDDDNYYLPSRLQTMLAYIEGTDNGMVFSLSYRCTLDGTIQEVFTFGKPPAWDYQRLLQGNYIDSGEVLIRKSVFDKIGYFKENLNTLEDWDIFIRIGKHFPVSFINQPLQCYSKHEGQRVHSTLNLNKQNIERIFMDFNESQKKKKILFVVPDNPGQTRSQLDMQDNFENALQERDDIEYKKEGSRGDVLGACQKYNPDLIIYFAPFIHKWSAFTFLKYNHYNNIAIMIEDPYAFHSVNKYAAQYFDVVCTNDSGCMAGYRELGKNVITFPTLSVNPNVHKLYKKEELAEHYKNSIVLVGYPYEERKQFMQSVADITKKYKTTLVGDQWHTVANIGCPVLEPTTVTPDEMMKYYCGSKIVLCLNRTFMGAPESPARSFIEAYSGSMVMIDSKRPKIVDFFKDGEEIVIFTNADDYRKKVEYYLMHDEEREKIAKAGQERAAKNYTFDRRISELFKLLEAQRFNVVII